jgi:hypothetical protein
VGEYLHIFYVNDKDAGAIPFDEGAVTENPVLYLEVPNPTRVGIAEKETLPENLTLFSNYPNPFNASTIIQYSLPEGSSVTIEIYNILGRKVKTLISATQPAGTHSVVWDARHLSSGIYFYRIKAGEYFSTKSCIILK